MKASFSPSIADCKINHELPFFSAGAVESWAYACWQDGKIQLYNPSSLLEKEKKAPHSPLQAAFNGASLAKQEVPQTSLRSLSIPKNESITCICTCDSSIVDASSPLAESEENVLPPVIIGFLSGAVWMYVPVDTSSNCFVSSSYKYHFELKPKKLICRHSSAPKKLAYTTQNGIISVLFEDGEMAFWGKSVKLRIFPAIPDAISLSLSISGEFFAVATRSRHLKIFRSFLTDSHLTGSSSSEDSSEAYNFYDENVFKRLLNSSSCEMMMAWHPVDSEVLALPGEKNVRVLNLRSKCLTGWDEGNLLSDDRLEISSLRFLQSEGHPLLLVSVSLDNAILVWIFDTQQPIYSLQDKEASSLNFYAIPEGIQILSLDPNAKVQFFSTLFNEQPINADFTAHRSTYKVDEEGGVSSTRGGDCESPNTKEEFKNGFNAAHTEKKLKKVENSHHTFKLIKKLEEEEEAAEDDKDYEETRRGGNFEGEEDIFSEEAESTRNAQSHTLKHYAEGGNESFQSHQDMSAKLGKLVESVRDMKRILKGVEEHPCVSPGRCLEPDDATRPWCFFWSNDGHITRRTDENRSTLEIFCSNFGFSKQKDSNGCTLAALCQEGYALASPTPSDSVAPCLLEYCAFSPGGQAVKIWEKFLQFPQQIVCLAVGIGFVAVLTSDRYLKIYSDAGMLCNTNLVAGSPVGITAYNDVLLVVSAIHARRVDSDESDEGCVSYSFHYDFLRVGPANINQPRITVLHTGVFTLKPGATITWMSISDICVPMILDSTGQLLGLYGAWGTLEGGRCFNWVPISNLEEEKEFSGGSPLWPVAVEHKREYGMILGVRVSSKTGEPDCSTTREPLFGYRLEKLPFKLMESVTWPYNRWKAAMKKDVNFPRSSEGLQLPWEVFDELRFHMNLADSHTQALSAGNAKNAVNVADSAKLVAEHESIIIRMFAKIKDTWKFSDLTLETAAMMKMKETLDNAIQHLLDPRNHRHKRLIRDLLQLKSQKSEAVEDDSSTPSSPFEESSRPFESKDTEDLTLLEKHEKMVTAGKRSLGPSKEEEFLVINHGGASNPVKLQSKRRPAIRQTDSFVGAYVETKNSLFEGTKLRDTGGSDTLPKNRNAHPPSKIFLGNSMLDAHHVKTSKAEAKAMDSNCKRGVNSWEDSLLEFMGP